MAEALGARISCRHGAQEAETPPPLRENRRCQKLPHRHGQGRQEQEDLGGAKGLIEVRVARSTMLLSKLRSGACPLSVFLNSGLAGRRCSAIPRPNHCAGTFWH